MEQLFAACSSATQSLLQGKKKGMCQFLGLKLLLSQFCSAKEIFSFSCSDLEWNTSFKLKQKSASGFCFPLSVSKTICSASICSYFSADLLHPQMQTKQLSVCSAGSLEMGSSFSKAQTLQLSLINICLPKMSPFLPWPPRSITLLTQWFFCRGYNKASYCYFIIITNILHFFLSGLVH